MVERQKIEELLRNGNGGETALSVKQLTLVTWYKVEELEKNVVTKKDLAAYRSSFNKALTLAIAFVTVFTFLADFFIRNLH